jgi:hypothetical protein
MAKENCDICGSAFNPGFVESHHIVPPDITRRAMLPESKTARICHNCQAELSRWYRTRISDIVFDEEYMRFRQKSGPELVKEYETEYQKFVDYKRKWMARQ